MSNPPKLTIDYETRSACDLKKSGTWRYSIHPTTEILCFVFRLPHWEKDRTEYWHPAFSSLELTEDCSDWAAFEEMMQWVRDGGLVESHNLFFEYCIWNNIGVKRYGWPELKISQCRCSAAKAAAHALPRNLDQLGAALRLRVRKDVEGHKLMLKVSKPRKSRKAERKAWDLAGLEHPKLLYHESGEQLARLIDYCRLDVLTEEAVSDRLSDLLPAETELFLLDLKINVRGFQIDRHAVRMALQLVHREAILLNRDLAVLTDKAVCKATQRKRVLQWFEDTGLWLPNTKAGTLDDTLKFSTENPELVSPLHRSVLAIVRSLGRSSTAKYCVSPDTRVLREDLTWAQASQLLPGEKLLAFTEASSGKAGRHFEISTVIANYRISQPRIEVSTTRGLITVSADHRFLSRKRSWGKGWVEASRLRKGVELAFFTEPWTQDTTREGGYLAGFLDGEGSVGSSRISWFQNPGAVRDHVNYLLLKKGFACNPQGNKGAFGITGGLPEAARLLGSLRPLRLLNARKKLWEGRRIWGKKTLTAKVISVKALPTGPVHAIETSSGTLITEGFFSHNCAMKRWWGLDGRVRGGLLYHGASTGRWSGKGIQPHNFPNGSAKETLDDGTVKKADMARLWSAIKKGERTYLIERWGGVMEALSTALRGAIVARKGQQLFVADYAAIEMRVAMWLAGEEKALEMLRNGEDLYVDMAKDIGPEADRQLGKVACLGADTLVLTDAGVKPITHVQLFDRLWDGKEWVSHEGLVYNGRREVLCLDGLSITPDHLIYTGRRWTTADEVAHDADVRYRARAHGSGSLQSLVLHEGPEAASRILWFDVGAPQRNSTLPASTMSFEGLPLDVMSAPFEKHSLLDRSVTGFTRILSRIKSTGHDSSTELAPSLLDVKTLTGRVFRITVDGVYESTENGWKATSRVGGGRPQDGGKCWPIWSHFRDGMTRGWSWIARITTGGMNPGTFVSLLDRSTPRIDVTSDSCNSGFSTLKPVFDLVNAGPRNRFTVITNRGALVVHNCLGLQYQMGAAKFFATCESWGIPITEELAEATVEAYRAKYYLVKQLWKDQERAAISAVETKKVVRCGVVEWFHYGLFLFCRLPSGRCLAYPYPEIRQKKTSWGSIQSGLTYMGVDPTTHQWRRQTSYGGLLVENIVQAISRDIMAEAMVRAEDQGYPVILSIHDELVSEAEHGTIDEYVSLLTQVPEWASGCPIAAEGWQGVRYRK